MILKKTMKLFKNASTVTRKKQGELFQKKVDHRGIISSGGNVTSFHVEMRKWHKKLEENIHKQKTQNRKETDYGFNKFNSFKWKNYNNSTI